IAALRNLRTELVSRDVVLSIVHTDKGTEQAKLAITDSFIAKNWTFANGVVMVHSCFGGASQFTLEDGECFNSCSLTGTLDPVALRDAMLNAGADVVVSFDNLTNASYAAPSIRFF